MSKRKFGIGIVSLLLVVFLAVGFLYISSNMKTSEDNASHDAFRYIQVGADFAKAYDTYGELSSDSEAVVFGVVKNIESYVAESRITSKFDFDVKSVEKGNINENEIITVTTIGGKVLYSDYLLANKEYLEAKTSDGYVNDEIKAHGNEYIESIFEGVPNVVKGDELLLFLSRDDNGKGYYIVGSSYYGRFYNDVNQNKIYKIIMEESNGSVGSKDRAQRLMVISREALSEEVQSTADDSPR